MSALCSSGYESNAEKEFPSGVNKISEKHHRTDLHNTVSQTCNLTFAFMALPGPKEGAAGATEEHMV